jgi:hypothetical protein
MILSKEEGSRESEWVEVNKEKGEMVIRNVAGKIERKKHVIV